MAKKPAPGNKGRFDPKHNKRFAVLAVLKQMPDASVTDVIEAVKKRFGHVVGPNLVYMVKTKSNMAVDGRPKKPKGAAKGHSMSSAADWVQAIKAARGLLKMTGSVANATALLKALDK